MSVIDVKQDGISFNHSVTADEYGRFVRSFSATWTVLFDNNDAPINRPILATTASASGVSVPAMFSTHPLDNWMYVYEITPTPVSTFLYEVSVQYKSIDDPLAISPVIKWDSESSQEPIDEDANGKSIANSAGQAFDPPIQETFHDKILKIERNEGTFDYERASAYEGSINSDTFWGFAAGKVLCRAMKADPRRVAALAYYTVNYEFVIREDGWKRRIKDQGLATKNDDGELVIAKDVDDNTMTEPILLDGSGKALAAGADAKWIEFETKTKKPFSILGLA